MSGRKSRIRNDLKISHLMLSESNKNSSSNINTVDSYVCEYNKRVPFGTQNKRVIVRTVMVRRLMDPAKHDEIHEAQAHVWNHMLNFTTAMSLKCGVELGIPDIIHRHGKPMTLPDLVSQLRVHPGKTQYVYRLMRTLVHSGIFDVEEEEEGEGYTLTPASLLLLKDEPLSVRPILLLALHPAFTKSSEYMTAWFQNDDPDPNVNPFHTAHGRSLWDYARHDPQFNNIFNEAMASDARFVASMLVTQCKDVFEGLNSLVDVGGGVGALAKAIADALPHINFAVFDLPHVVAGLEGTNNVNYIAGDMFQQPIPPAHAILLKSILHDWNDEECVKILQKCKESIPSKDKGGKVIIIEIIMETQQGDDKLVKTQLLFDMLMMIVTSGRQRNEKEWEKLFLDSGFSGYKITPILGIRSIIEVYP